MPSGGALLGAAVLAVVFHPVHAWLVPYIPHRSLRALVSDLFVVLFFFVPLGALIWAAVVQSDRIVQILGPIIERVHQTVRMGPEHFLARLAPRFPWLSEQLMNRSAELQSYVMNLSTSSVGSFAKLGADAAKTSVVLIGYVLLTIFALFFFLRDGERLLKQFNDLLPLRSDLKARLEDQVGTMVVGVVRGAILTSMIQGVVATVGYLIVKTPSAFFLGFLTMICSIIPAIGSALVWGPLCIYYISKAAFGKGAFVLIWGLAVTGSIDNLLRPWLVGAKQDVPFFWMFLSMVGGIQVFGVFGLLIGPLVMAVLMLLLDMYQQVYLDSETTVDSPIIRHKNRRKA